MSRRMKWVGHVAYSGKMRNPQNILVRRPEGKNHSEDLGVNGKIILEWILGKSGGRICRVDASGSG
jgi:hypothetical protein